MFVKITVYISTQIKKMVNEKKISLNRYNDYLKLIDAKIKLKQSILFVFMCYYNEVIY